MNIQTIHPKDKAVSAVSIFKSDAGNATAIQLLKFETLKEHITKTPALLVCVMGEIIFENEKGDKSTLKTGDFIHIEKDIKHWLIAIMESQLILIK